MRNYKLYKEQRNKAFLGAIIGAVGGIAGSVVNSINQRNIQRDNLINTNRANTYQMAQNLSNVYTNQDYVDDFNNKIQFKRGGKVRFDNNRYKYDKVYANGGNIKIPKYTLNDLDNYLINNIIAHKYGLF